jgi:hypothetical protein
VLSKQEEEAERRATLENDRKVREQQERGTTMFQHAQSHANDEAGGRFAAVSQRARFRNWVGLLGPAWPTSRRCSS